MDWKKQLKQLEDAKCWDPAIELMQKVIAENPDNLDAYLAMNYLLMNLLVEEDHDATFKHDYYAALTKKYFDESYAKFSDNPEYLYYTGRTAYMSEWYFDISREKAREMLERSTYLDPNNPIYQWNYYDSLNIENPDDKKKLTAYTKMILEPNSCISKILKSQGSLGEYILEMMIHWAGRILHEPAY